jgi:hypothetical protein
LGQTKPQHEACVCGACDTHDLEHAVCHSLT